ncbi:AAA family ATPase [Arthrobacter sp.]|uniref:MinD/ParA family ATP-binding protein n=1 Tax=Arthrobacter sp. TaxID=1667 RepID=UPI00289CAA87|nr:AAA family ATPase [Arthrobacter sp.]
MTENLSDPERPDALPTRRGRRAAEARLAAHSGDPVTGSATADPVAAPPETAEVAGTGWNGTKRAAAVPVGAGRRSRLNRTPWDLESPADDGGVPETDSASETEDADYASVGEGPLEAQVTATPVPASGPPAAETREAAAGVLPEDSVQPALVSVGAAAAGGTALRTTESDTTIFTEHAASAEETSAEETDTDEPASDAPISDAPISDPTPDASISGHSTSDVSTSDFSTPDASTSDDSTPDDSTPDDSTPDLSTPDESSWGHGLDEDPLAAPEFTDSSAEAELPPAPAEARTYAWDGPEPATAGMSRIPLLSGLPSSRLPAVVPEPPAEPPMNSDELPLVDMAGRSAGAGEHLPGVPSLDPEQMPSDLRERTRLAVRGEPNDVRRATFLDTGTSKIPATRGFRGFLASMGLRVAPSAKELAERRDTRMVSQHWPGPRTISVVNGKGGANKTPTTVMLAALFARNGGGPVLAWDNNETRGTLGWRTEQAQHDATVMDLLPETGLLLSPVAQSAMLAKFVHHQTDDKYDVLRSNPNVLASEQKVTRTDFDALHTVASKYFRLNVVDSGNDESAERWLRMIDHTDQLVIATTTVEEHAEAGALLLEALQERGGRYAELARGAVVIVSQADRNGTEAQARKVAEAFKVLARAAVTIPYDPALVKGQIRYASLRPATQRAWLKATAAVAGGL